ncbi:hypothetical protein PE074_06530 [Wohlfahrtiimonas chitiniclastica]|uniref:hypothetical protein n=1 Tax=Wohlfahrtiimonas chitiniclastica TaxID=400946 RepID=UPI0007B4196B|nr:hypothetical protein [Wohlfahrtiimonas chitiniclastica]MBS7814776.1 hypothetical protein [Wohlfahrtiimonas chitiniclastica]WHR54751.1 hypothetical protein PE074_06530 [Wohlfahrtiimonas chitiniclastica]
MAESNFKSWLHNSTTAVAGFFGSALLSLAIWIFSQMYGQSVKHLESIDNKFDVLTKDIVAIKLQDSANNVRMSRIEDDVVYLKGNDKEHSKRLSELEKSSQYLMAC